MKKLLILSSVVLAACVATTEEETGVIRLYSEPRNCEFLYTVTTSVTNYDITDAYNYIENRILEHEPVGDTYYIAKEETIKNEGAIFGPENTFKFKTKVYNCGNLKKS